MDTAHDEGDHRPEPGVPRRKPKREQSDAMKNDDGDDGSPRLKQSDRRRAGRGRVKTGNRGGGVVVPQGAIERPRREFHRSHGMVCKSVPVRVQGGSAFFCWCAWARTKRPNSF